ncbi:hypothetical protein [Streptomyces sp. NBC_00485]|uniref:hypothetical protein n=1 Tax=Streptomyces sp. NBC_00485 TaxID=2975758 RepID=UPI003FA7D34D
MRGLNAPETGQALELSPLTAKTRVSRFMRKPGARDRARPVVVAHESEPGSPGTIRR